MEHIREVRDSGHRIRLDLAPQVLELRIPEDPWRAERGITATLDSHDRFASAASLNLKAKQFDDGLYAATELAAQQGAGTYAGKLMLLTAIAEQLATSAPPHLLAACELGGIQVAAPAERRTEIDAEKAAFLGDAHRSKPLGFHTWSPALERIFRQDRLLQKELPGGETFRSVIDLLRSNAALREAYSGYLRLISRLTNPLPGSDLRPQLGSSAGTADAATFFPASRSHETDLMKRLFGDRIIPNDFNLMEELIRRIRSGALDLRPSPVSGWYDHQLWSIEPLAVPDRTPEANRLELDETYRKHLLELFKGTYALMRETHVKQLECVAVGAAMGRYEPPKQIHVRPRLSAEPLPTVYLRRALSYRFVREVLEETFGGDGLKTMHRITQDGPARPSLDDELRDLERIFFGAHLTVSHELGMDADTAAPADSGSRFVEWTQGMASDPDLGRDARMMVPVFYDLARGKMKVWAFLGWTTSPVRVSFAHPPRLLSNDADRGASGGLLHKMLGRESRPVEVVFAPASQTLATPVFEEVYVDRVLNRDEFRKHCDKYRTRRAIVEHLAR